MKLAVFALDHSPEHFAEMSGSESFSKCILGNSDTDLQLAEALEVLKQE